MSENRNENKTEALNEEAKKTELSLEELEQVTGGSTPLGMHVILTSVIDSPVREMKAFQYGE